MTKNEILLKLIPNFFLEYKSKWYVDLFRQLDYFCREVKGEWD